MSERWAQKAPDIIWWEYVSGPSRFVLETANILRTGKSVYLYANAALPFRDAFFQLVSDSLRETNSALLLDEAIGEGDPGSVLVERFGLRADYRETMQPADFLRKRYALANRLTPIVVQGDDVRNWLEFIGAYKSTSMEDGLFVLETGVCLSTNVHKHRNAIQMLEYDGFVTEYDSLTFAGLIVNSAEATVEQKRYAAAMAVSFYGKDAQAITSFSQQYTTAKNPADMLPEGAFSDEEITRGLWNAQVQELFPLIMRETREFVKTWRPEIGAAFDYIQASRSYPGSLFQNGLRNTYDEPVNSPEELELATILYLIRKRRKDANGCDTAEYVLFIPEIKARERIGLLYRMRNCIAHGKTCPVTDVVQLLSCDE